MNNEFNVDSINDLSIKELKQFLENKLDILSLKELFQFFNYETMKKIELLDNSFPDKPYLKTVLQKIENKLSNLTNKLPSLINISTMPTAFNFSTNITDVEILDIEKMVLYPQYLTHENTHPNEIISLKYQEIKNKNIYKIQQLTNKDFDKYFPDIKLQNNKQQQKSLYDETVLKQLLISYKTNLYIQTIRNNLSRCYKETNDIRLIDEYNHYGILEYMSAIELEARVQELKVIPLEYDIIQKEQDLNIKLKQLKCLKENIDNYCENAIKQKTLIEEYLKICKSTLKKHKQPEHKIFNISETREYVKNRLDFIVKNCENILDVLNKDIEQIKNVTKSYVKNPVFNKFNIAIENLFDNNKDPYEMLRYNPTLTLSVLNTINRNFNFDFIKYKTDNNNVIKENNLKLFTDKLYEIYNEIDQAVYDINLNQQFKEEIKNIFINIFTNEKNIYLISDGIDKNIIDLIEEENVFNEDDYQKTLLNNKLNDYNETIKFKENITVSKENLESHTFEK